MLKRKNRPNDEISQHLVTLIVVTWHSEFEFPFPDILDFNEQDKLTLAVSPRFNWKDVEKIENRWKKINFRTNRKREREGKCAAVIFPFLSISLEIKIEDGLFPLFAISWCSRWEKQKQGISDLNSFLADVYHQKRDKGHEYLKYLSVKGFPSLAKCPSLFKP